MCVKIARRVKKPSKKVRWAWKTINVDSTQSTWYPIMQPGVFERGTWVRAEHPRYPFQCYQVQEPTNKWWGKKLRVLVRLVEGYGEDEWNDRWYRVIFAREIFVPKERERRAA